MTISMPTTPASASAPATATASVPAPTARRILAQSLFEVKAILRNGEQLMVALFIPLGLLFMLATTNLIEINTGDWGRLDFLVPGVMAMAIMSGAFTSQAIATAFDRRNGVLRFLATTPLGRSGMLWAKVAAVFSVALIQLAAVAALAAALGWRVSLAHLVVALPAVVLGVAAFTGFALFLAGTLRAEGVLAMANILLIVLVVAGGIVAPADQLPAGLGAVAQFLPSGALGDAMRAALIDGKFAVLPLAILAAWSVFFAALTAKTFKWQS